ncbi:MAG: preprotein translocase subunit SecE [Sphaerochaeta sp.]|jgi:preprotein translocase subunit SecE|nr:preprotein translocase subunit SecE [Sphaerochaeta sp.]MCH3920362.1 preprotein translocase subunit SecE [Sphaerochaeta sp.]MCI2045548.1 preprotein translocase subunit SecE [Sphaerochaeta sp.]MCI2076141.1 preprotein translocase subunit SecE [Sphaerochaeta sp.]MCI2096820.1 preprotein translocase subunit SecE [Sphaerochaeta sp.]
MKKMMKYFKECHNELKKVVWPTREVVLNSTKVVIVSTILVAIFLGFVDFVLLKILYVMF